MSDSSWSNVLIPLVVLVGVIIFLMVMWNMVAPTPQLPITNTTNETVNVQLEPNDYTLPLVYDMYVSTQSYFDWNTWFATHNYLPPFVYRDGKYHFNANSLSANDNFKNYSTSALNSSYFWKAPYKVGDLTPQQLAVLKQNVVALPVGQQLISASVHGLTGEQNNTSDGPEGVTNSSDVTDIYYDVTGMAGREYEISPGQPVPGQIMLPTGCVSSDQPVVFEGVGTGSLVANDAAVWTQMT